MRAQISFVTLNVLKLPSVCVTHLTMCAWVQMMHFGCRTYIPIFEFTPSYLQNSINSDSAILSCRRCTYKRIPALAVEQINCAVLLYTGRYYLALNTAFLCLYTSASIKKRGCYCLIPSIPVRPNFRSGGPYSLREYGPPRTQLPREFGPPDRVPWLYKTN